MTEIFELEAPSIPGRVRDRFEVLHAQLMDIPEELRDELIVKAQRELKKSGELEALKTNMEEDCEIFNRAIEMYEERLQLAIRATDHLELVISEIPDREAA